MRFLWVLVLTTLCALPAGADATADYQALARAQKQAAALEQTDRAGAIAALYSLFRERPEMEPWVAVLGVSAIVRLQRASEQTETAYQLCDWALGKYAWHPAVARTVADKAGLLNADKRYGEVEALVAQHWAKLTETHFSHANAVIAQWSQALERQEKAAAAAAALRKALREVPSLLDESQQAPYGWIYNRLTHSLGGSEHREEALRWAKARFLACAFEAGAIERSARSLARAWKAGDPGGAGLRAFAAAQAGTGGNALDGIPLVVYDAALRKAQLTRLQGGPQATHDRISILLVAGGTRDALGEALRLLKDYPDQAAGVLEVCRCLKATAGSLRRARAGLGGPPPGAGAPPPPARAAPRGAPPPAAALPETRAALAKTAVVPDGLVAEAARRPGAETPVTVADTGWTIAGLHEAVPTEVNTAALPAVAKVRVATSDAAAVPIPKAVMPGLEAVAITVVAPAALPGGGLTAVTVATTPGASPGSLPAPAENVPTSARLAGAAVPSPVAVPPGVGAVRVPIGPAAVVSPEVRGVAEPAIPGGGHEVALPAVVAPQVAPAGGALVEGANPREGSATLPARVSEHVAGVALALHQLAAGKITPDEAWQTGRPTAEDLLRAIEDANPYRQGAYLNGLAGLLATHFAERVRDVNGVSPKAQLALARHYGSLADARCAGLYEALLDGREQAWIELAAAGLADYYATAGDLGRTAQVWLRVGEAPILPAVRANALVAAGRTLEMMGRPEEAVGLYARATSVGYGWASGVALYYLACRLVESGKYEEARRALARPVVGRYADQIQVALLTLRFHSYYVEGDFPDAEDAMLRIRQHTRSVGRLLEGEGLEMLVSRAEDAMQWIPRWKADPLLATPSALRVFPGRGSQLVKRRIVLRSYGPVPVEVLAPSPAVTVLSVGRWAVDASRCFHEMAIDLEIAAGHQGDDLHVTIRSERLPGLRLTVPIVVHDLPVVRASPRLLLLRRRGGAGAHVGVVSLTSDRPFHITRIEAGGSGVSARVTEAVDARVGVTVEHVGGPACGRLRMVTDVGRSAPVEVDYVVCDD